MARSHPTPPELALERVPVGRSGFGPFRSSGIETCWVGGFLRYGLGRPWPGSAARISRPVPMSRECGHPAWPSSPC